MNRYWFLCNKHVLFLWSANVDAAARFWWMLGWFIAQPYCDLHSDNHQKAPLHISEQDLRRWKPKLKLPVFESYKGATVKKNSHKPHTSYFFIKKFGFLVQSFLQKTTLTQHKNIIWQIFLILISRTLTETNFHAWCSFKGLFMTLSLAVNHLGFLPTTLNTQQMFPDPIITAEKGLLTTVLASLLLAWSQSMASWDCPSSSFLKINPADVTNY